MAVMLSALPDGLAASLKGSRRGARGPRGALVLGVMLAVVTSGLGGCAIQPWVKPYEREHLADPIMQFSRDTLPGVHLEHIHSVREGAHGATGVQGGGCGCN